MKHPDPRLRAYCDLLVDAPVSVTSVRDHDGIWSVHIEDALTALPVVQRLAPASVVDVGSGGGSPGLPLALVTGIATTLLEATESKCVFLRSAVSRLGAPCAVVCDRSELYARGDGRDAFDLALARALAAPVVAAELCLPLVRMGGHALLWTADIDLEPVSAAAAAVGGELAESVVAGPNRRLLVLAKTAPTPERFPRRPGMASKRPLIRVPSGA
ncbi:MAG TPA: RsmG family class I SAM-dependent methyltransferase [Gaiellales bacterium]